MRLRLLQGLILVALVAAGCATDDAPPAPPVAGDAAAVLPPWLTLIALPEPNVATEPEARVAPDGRTVYVTAPGPLDGSLEALLWRSDDAGRTWVALGAVPNDVGSQDVTLDVQPDGTLWVGSMWLRNPRGGFPQGALCTAVSVSADLGVTWETNPDVCLVAGGVDRPWLSAKEGRAFLIQGGNGRPEFLTTTDNTAWTPVMMPQRTGAHGPPTTDADGRLHVPLVASIEQQGAPDNPLPLPMQGIFLHTSADDGATWTSVRVTEDPVWSAWPRAAMGDGGGVIAWMTPREGVGGFATSPGGADNAQIPRGHPWDVRVSVLDPAGGWSAPATLDDRGLNGFPWSAARGPHRLVSWVHTDDVDDGGAPLADAAWRMRAWLDGRLFEVPGPIHVGPLDRDFGDFIGVDVTPEGVAILPLPVTGGDDGPSMHVALIDPRAG